jgi:hypothetical protein
MFTSGKNTFLRSRRNCSIQERAEIDNRFGETGDEWVDPDTGLHVGIMYRFPAWIEHRLDRVLVRRLSLLTGNGSPLRSTPCCMALIICCEWNRGFVPGFVFWRASPSQRLTGFVLGLFFEAMRF